MCVGVRACVYVCVCACLCACLCACVCARVCVIHVLMEFRANFRLTNLVSTVLKLYGCFWVILGLSGVIGSGLQTVH